ncbi:PREDICTED: L-type lectin-domain containing receptor kinase IX.1-like [Populus euphratica]|uniref:L-type lectin-domain containing receptor kinase IX.1-like n=1 Tax=Populus euphratica TaxID=75702 RepID=A0AAJ6V6C4_POPEU|nr:PREDICTED: L-type lectin-domain containing receptor kinase IX.1-like [Populus euphratica]
MDENCTNPRKFSYQTLACATNNFSEKAKLGEGATGSVFKGFLRELSCFVGVKRIVFGSKYGMESYLPEVKILTKLKHENLVNLIGWSCNKKELLIAYEFVANKTLEYHLFNETVFLTWGQRKTVAWGLASALLYLHEEREQSVLHCDIKLDNILLDSNFSPKLCDFGLARPVEHEQESGYPTVLTGAPGYLAPECKKSGKASKESDIYSFGVVVLQMACGKPAVEQFQENGMKFELKLVDWVLEKIERGENASAVADPRLGLSYDEKEMEQLIFVGLSCANPNPYDRPSIWEVIKMLKC